MIKQLRKIFNFIFKMDKFLIEEQIHRINGAGLIGITLLSIGFIGMFAQKFFKSDFIIRVAAFFLGTFIYLLIPYVSIKKWRVKKYILFGEEQEFHIIIHEFTLKSYLMFVGYFSYFLVFPVVGIPLMFRIFNINFLLTFVQNNLIQTIYFTIFLASFFWFSYHIIILNLDLNQAKEKLALFTAIITTISTILSNIMLVDFKLILAYILLSYSWIRYLIECKANEAN